MCGIAGVFGSGELETVRAMASTLVHRGPDDGHAVSGVEYALAARRLSIVGVEDGRQPLSDATQTIWACQNGELYNFPEVKRTLLSRGHKFQTRCDTELLPHLYQEYGTNLVHHIDGMFAIAVWDTDNKIGLLARDRMGKKPLYYHVRNGVVYFASEIKALLKIPGFQRRIDFEALSHYFSFKHVPAPLSIFQDVRILPPAHMLVFRPGGSIQVQRYWDVDFSANEQQGASEDELSDQLITLLRQGVKRRLMSDVPIGFFLSGGIDSSLSAALAAEMSSEPIKTFTLTYSDGSTTPGKDLDRKWARWTASRYTTEHYEESVEFSRFPETLRSILRCFDQPFAGTVSTYFLAGLIAKHVKVAISGDGADELFGSYLSHRLAFPLANYPRFLETGDTDLISPFQSQTDLLARLYEKEDWSWRSKLFVHTDEDKLMLYSSDVEPLVKQYSSQDRLKQDFATLTAVDPLNRILEAEFRTIFPDQVLAFVDRLSMAHSLEVRSAYLDTDVVRFASRLPGQLKIKNGQTKYLLKKAALKYFPEDMVFRKKEGFLMPITEWFLTDLEPYVREVLSPQRLNAHGIFDKNAVCSLIDGLYSGTADYTQVNKVFSLVMFQEWFDLYMTDPVPAMVRACS